MQTTLFLFLLSEPYKNNSELKALLLLFCSLKMHEAMNDR